jgi:RNA polymerase sigma factor (TIGR02999 family)
MDSWAPLLSEAAMHAPGAKEKLFSALYVELHRLARQHLRQGGAVANSPTTLLHETYLGIAQGNAEFPDRGRFMSYASRVMRGLIIDFSRERRAQKRGGEFQFTQLNESLAEQSPDPAFETDTLCRLSEALDELAVHDPRLAEVVDLRYFCGFSLSDIAGMRGVALRTIQRDWEKARVLLFRLMTDQQPPTAQTCG